MSAAKSNPFHPLDEKFLKSIKEGDRLFHYPHKGNIPSSQESNIAEYILYSVIDLPTENDVTLLGAFDLQERKKIISRRDLLNGQWWRTADQ